MSASELESAIRQFRSARHYLLGLIESLDGSDWYWTPPGPLATHVAWQVGHLAVAQYGLMLFRQRGRREEDAALMSGDFRKRFMKGSSAAGEAETGFSPAEIRQVLDRVDRQAMEELSAIDAGGLSEPSEPPHAGPPTRLGSLLFASHHEMLHAGQIGLLRRMMGRGPLR